MASTSASIWGRALATVSGTVWSSLFMPASSSGVERVSRWLNSEGASVVIIDCRTCFGLFRKKEGQTANKLKHVLHKLPHNGKIFEYVGRVGCVFVELSGEV